MSEPEEHQLGDLGDLADGQMRYCDVDDYGVMVCRVEGQLYALEDNCSHADTPLSEGRLRGYNVTCPLHGTSFDVRTGEHSGPPAYTGVACYSVTETDAGAVAVRLPGDDDEPGDGYGEPGAMFRTR